MPDAVRATYLGSPPEKGDRGESSNRNTDRKMDSPRKLRELYSHHLDSTIWNDLRFRDDDIIIATYAKAGTTWTQQIAGQLLLGPAPELARSVQVVKRGARRWSRRTWNGPEQPDYDRRAGGLRVADVDELTSDGAR